MKEQKNIAILGSTGSIGRQSLDIIAEYPELFRAYLLTANTSVELLTEQAIRFRPKYVIISDSTKYETLKSNLADYPIDVLSGSEAITAAMCDSNIDLVVTAMVGYSGLAPTIQAIQNNIDIALANKETLVVAGELITNLLKESTSRIYPVDSEHGAIYQCLVGEDKSSVSKLILTASGGPFRTKTKEELEFVTIADALNHPNWSMGKKITIDSASMMNKGFEVMEAKWLFGISHKDIEVVVHPQSIIHSMVEFVDGSIKAQLGLPDMHIPIRYALNCPTRLKTNDRKLAVHDYQNLTFEEPDFEKFPMLGLAYKSMDRQGNTPCVLNAANEIAVDAFLTGKIRFTEMPRIVERTMEAIPFINQPNYSNLVETNAEARKFASSIIK